MSIYNRQQVIDKLGEKGAMMPCEACGTQQWILPHAEGQVNSTPVILNMLLGAGISQTVSFVPTICVNCGHTRLFNIEHLMKAGDAR